MMKGSEYSMLKLEPVKHELPNQLDRLAKVGESL